MKSLIIKSVIRFSMLLALMLLLIFLPAGTFHYWQAWILSAILIVPMIFVLRYFLKHDPEFLASRTQFREKEKQQKWIIRLTTPVFFLAFIIPALDHRYSWSAVPTWLVLVADVMILLGYLMVFAVFRQNRFASRIIEVKEGQQVIKTGFYSVVRHPMYLGVIIMYLPMPLALGSFWGLVPMAMLPAVLAFRVLNEEKVLRRELPGYEEYCTQTRYRVLPGIW